MATNAVQIPGSTVLVMNQSGSRRGPHYMKRGTTCCNGCRVTTYLFTSILTFGLMISIMSLAYIPFTYLTLLGLPVGLYLIGLYVHLFRKAKREFDALPPDHPDRFRYNGFNITHLPINLNPPSNQVIAPPNPEPQVPPLPGGQNYVFPESSYPQGPTYPGQGPSAPPQGPYPPPQGPYSPPQGSYQPPQEPSPPPQGYTPTQGPTAPYPPPPGYYPPPAKYDDDPPPPYSAL